MKHSAVNGLVDENTVQQMYDMIVENSRKYLDAPSSAYAKVLQTKGKDRKNRRIKVLGKVRRIMRVIGVDQWNIGLRIVRISRHKWVRRLRLNRMEIRINRRM